MCFFSYGLVRMRNAQMREGKLQSHYRFENIILKLQFTFLLEFMTWDRKSVLCVSCEPADAYYLVNGLANGCWFDGLQSSAILLHHNVSCSDIY